MKSLDARGAALCVLGMTILGGSVPISRLILDYPVLTGQALRYALAAIILVALVWIARSRDATSSSAQNRHEEIISRRFAQDRRAGRGARAGRGRWGRVRGRDLGVLAALAVTGLVAFNVLLLEALRHADAPLVGTVVGAAPLGLALLGPLLRGGRPVPRLVWAAAVVVAGTALVHGGGRADRIGLLCALGALGGEIAFSMLAAVVLPRLGAVRVSAWSCALAVPLLVLAAVPNGELARWRPPTAAEAVALGYLAVLLTVGAFVAWFTGLRRLGVERAGMFVGVLPVATLAATALYDARPPDPLQAAGVLVVAAGLTLGLLAPRPVDHEVEHPRPALARS